MDSVIHFIERSYCPTITPILLARYFNSSSFSYTGSSTIFHKIRPIFFEASEVNLPSSAWLKNSDSSGLILLRCAAISGGIVSTMKNPQILSINRNIRNKIQKLYVNAKRFLVLLDLYLKLD